MNLEDRKASFANEIAVFKDKYSREMLVKFYNHWTQIGTEGRMLFENEREKIKGKFIVNKRLASWYLNNKRYEERNPTNKQPTSKVGHAIEVFNTISKGINGNAKSDIEFL